MSEPIINRIIDGVHADNDPRYQPENTMRWARNGVIMDAGEGNYVWVTIKGTRHEFTLASVDRLFSWCTIRERFFIITLNESEGFIKIIEVIFNFQSGISRNRTRWTGSNDVLNLSYDNPITRIIGFYENDEIQRIYFTDNYNKPRVINAGYKGTDSFYSNNKLILIDDKFIDFSPVISNGFGNFRFVSLAGGGSLKAGTYFFAWRLFHKGYYTDWSYHSAGVKINPGTVIANNDAYQAFEGASADTTVTKRIDFELSSLDADYDSIQIAAFHSGDLNSASPGVIFYDGDITSETMEVSYYGNENAGIVTIEELNEVSVVIEKCRDFDIIKQRAAILNIKTREEIDLPNKLNVEIETIEREILLDQSGYPDHTWTTNNKALFASMRGGFVWPTNIVRAGVQYYGVETGSASINGSAISFIEGEIITFDDIGTLTSGKLVTTVALKKYRKGGTVPDSSYDNYEWKRAYDDLKEEYLDFKSTTISNWLKGYPGGEIIRLGIVFFDLTGSPYFGRWLRNIHPDNSIGDVTIPDRNLEAGNIPLVRNYGETTTAEGSEYLQTNGVTIGLKVSGIDITKFRDQISGFMIVRAPIARRNIGMGIISKVLDLEFQPIFAADEDVLMSYHGFVNKNSDVRVKPNIYSIYSPEDIFDLKDFSIEPGDKLVPLQYLDPFLKAEAPIEPEYEGLGRRIIPGDTNTRSLYQKFYIPELGVDGAGTNGTLGVEHEILYSTPINIGDDDVVVDPRNATKLYKRLGGSVHATIYKRQRGSNSKHSVIVIDSDDTGTNPVGHHNRAVTHPIALLCNIKRENNNPYGGEGDSALANTYYIACGHYQEINDTVLADIEAGGKYIFNEIEIYGGDSYICLMDINRIIPDEDQQFLLLEDTTGHSIIFPVESRVNIAMREGNHIAKDRSYDVSDNVDGIRYEQGEFKLPEYNYNDGYSTDDINDYYAPLPYNYSLDSEFDVMIRWSPFKTNGERQDSFRRFLPNDYVQLNSEYGEGVNIRDKFNRLVYWQRDAVGYIPIDERALTQNEFGSPIQLGTGGVFERYDEMTNRIGNSHQFGLVESDMGFHWYDAKREIFVTLTDSLQFSQDSIAKGLNNYFENTIPDNILNYDNPFETYGINGGYDPYLKVLFYNFRLPGEIYKTIGFDVRRQKFIGEFDYPSMIFMRKDNMMLTVPFQSNSVYSHNLGDYLTVYGNKVTAELSLVVKNQNLDSLLFDSFKVNGNDEFFESITIQTSSLTKEETIQQLQAGEHRFVTKNYLYRNGKWHGTFPKINRERAVDTYLIVTFKTEKAMTKFLDMVTTTRKAY